MHVESDYVLVLVPSSFQLNGHRREPQACLAVGRLSDLAFRTSYEHKLLDKWTTRTNTNVDEQYNQMK